MGTNTSSNKNGKVNAQPKTVFYKHDFEFIQDIDEKELTEEQILIYEKLRVFLHNNFMSMQD